MRRWLSLYALSITSIVVVAFVFPLGILIRDLASDRAMAAAEREAQTVARFASTADGGDASIGILASTLSAEPETTVVLGDGSILGADLPVGIDLSAARERGLAYRQPLDGGGAVIVPVVRGVNDTWVVVVDVPEAALRQGVTSAWTILGVLGIVLIGLAFVVADQMGRAVVKPISDLVDATNRLGKGELTVEVQPSGPSELAAVGVAFNTLTARVSTLMDRERETAADLSHRLRTPLTALRLDIEALGNKIDTSRLQSDVDALERVVDHVIHEARRPVREGGGAISDLAAIVHERAAFWGSLAEDQSRPWSVEVGPKECLVKGSQADFGALVDALLGNIFAHTPPGTPYRVTLDPAGDGMVELGIADEGDGFTDSGLLERGSSGASSTGLGVDIVRRTAEAAGGSATWSLGVPSGTVATIILPSSGTGDKTFQKRVTSHDSGK
ncbi:MAG: HAMP domain-containing histidine kinase [Actinomycetia bacterium]|nr:HAMP domain-containing histidine kinase [Actinomycetes bacterium]